MTCSENNVLIEHICVLDSLNIWIDFVFYLTYECLFFWISFMCFCCCKLFLYVIYTNHKDFFLLLCQWATQQRRSNLICSVGIYFL